MATPLTSAITLSSVRRENLFPTLWPIPGWAHPEVVYYYPDWKLIRDAVAGEKEIKAETTRYLTRMEGMTDEEYLLFLDRATYYNFSGRTLGALNGTLFRRTPVISDLPPRLAPELEKISINDETFIAFASATSSELLSLGRVGVLVDLPDFPTVTPRPYLVSYTAEHILDWDLTRNAETGRNELTKVVLREVKLSDGNTAGERKYVARYRVLRLQAGVYTQELFESDTEHAELSPEFSRGVVVPTRQGAPLSYIPFVLLGSSTNAWTVSKPSLLDIAQLNLSHYRSYAQLEQGRFYTGFPIYWAEIPQGAEGGIDYQLGPSRVWEVPAGSKPGLLEFYGSGLKYLETALETKEQQAASLGGRIIGFRSGATSESNNAEKLKALNEQSMLLSASQTMDASFTLLLRIWAWWSGTPKEEADKITVEFNKDFLFSDIGSREFRAIHALYKDGIIPIDVVYEYLRKAFVIPDWMSVDEFKKMLDKMESFPNQVDVEAMMEGFPDRKTQLEQDNLEEERKDAKAAALLAAKTPVVPGSVGKPPLNPRAPAKTV